jgi:predicted DNA-binding protein with PD1-like motif
MAKDNADMKEKLIQDQGQRTYVVVFDKGDELMAGIMEFATRNNLAASRITAIGGFSEMTLAYFSRQNKEYKMIPLYEQVEVLALVGDITLNGDERQVHSHVVVGLSDGTTRGGHIMQARVWPTLEVIVTESPLHLQRQTDPETGLALIRL